MRERTPLLGRPGAATAEKGRTRPVGVAAAIGMAFPGAGTTCVNLLWYAEDLGEKVILMWIQCTKWLVLF